METFENIHLDFSKTPGRCRFAESGLGWKPNGEGDTFTLHSDQINQGHWSRAARGFEVKVYTRSSTMYQLDGFVAEDFDRLARVFKTFYNVTLENKEHALMGWNWGKAEFAKSELTFSVKNRPAFEIPYTEVANTNLAGRNEIAVEISLADDEPGVVSKLGGAKTKGKKTGGARDQLVEARFYIPGTVAKKEKKATEDDDASGEEVEDEEQNAASAWYDELIDRADIGDVAGDTLASFLDLLHLTPRGRFDLDMYEKSFRLRGKTYDYKIQYDHIKKFFIFNKPDEVHILVTIGLEPPLRQGQTRYPFLVMQLKKDEDVELDLNVSEEELAALNAKHKNKSPLVERYSGPIYDVLEKLFTGIAGVEAIKPSPEYTSRHSSKGVKCSIKANEGHLFCLDKGFMFVPKPATFVEMRNIQMITMSRVGGAMAASRTFDITMILKGGGGEFQFSNINREEQESLEDFFKAKGLKVRNEMVEDEKILAAALREQNIGSSDDEMVAADRGSADEDSESDDEDFQADDESDVALEYDSGADVSSGDSDVEMDDADADANADADADVDASDKDEPEPPKKKPKTKK